VADLGDIQIREITGSRHVALTLRLRYDVWCEIADVKPEFRELRVISDTHDEHAQHWAAFDGDDIVASARMCVHDVQADCPDAAIFCREKLPSPVGTISRLVVHKSRRKLGLARHFDTCRTQAARKAGAKCLVVTASGRRIAALQDGGFRMTDYLATSPFAPPLVVRGLILIL
jgi:hypothetical protein